MLRIRGDGVTVRNLNIRGPWANQKAATGRVWEPSHYGVHVFEKSANPFVWCDNFTLETTEINGYSANGLKLTGGAGHQILNNTIVYNFETAVAVFAADTTGIKVNGNILSYNGANRLDTCADYSEYCDNSLDENGWAHDKFPKGGEGQGFILNPCKREMKDLLIEGNSILRSARSAIAFLDDGVGSFNGVDIRNNYLLENGTSNPNDNGWGVRFDGSIQNLILEYNDAKLNFSGCYNIPYSGVTVGDNCCDGQGGSGPWFAPCLQ
ncbi:hypothetical protein BH23GEM10_BH23GEM10_14960 [soil metagenome]